jgi:hypothetical protein
MRRMAVAAIVISILMSAHASSLHAASVGRIRTLNVGAQGVMTLVSGVVQGKVRGGRDVLRCVLSGFAAGYGSFQSKIMVRNGSVGKGWLLANVSASVSENAAAGKNPMAQLGYSIGPARFRVPIPWLDPEADAYSYMDISVQETASMVRAFRDGDRIRFRSGMFAFERLTPYPAKQGVGPFTGYTWGMFPGVVRGAPPDIRRHEVIHAIQSLQGDSVEPSFRILTFQPARAANGKRSLIRFEHLKIGLVNDVDGFALDQQRYQDRWTEIEAYRLAQRRAP